MMKAQKRKLTFGSLFAGIGGFDLGLERAGMECRWQVDNDTHCLDVRLRHWPDVPQFGDVNDVGRHNLEAVDLICGGFPCQDVSVAGRREGLAGERSGLWFEFLRVITEIKPEWVIVENVPGLLSSNGGRDMATIVGGLAECGYWWAYRVLDLQFFGVPQHRRRVFIVASLTRGRPQEVLFERESSPWDIAPGREAGEGAARNVAFSPFSHYGYERAEEVATIHNPQQFSGSQNLVYTPELSPVLLGEHHDGSEDGRGRRALVAYGGGNTAGPIDVAAARNAHGSNRYDFESETFVFESRYARNGRGAPDSVVPPLKAESQGDGATLVAFDRYNGSIGVNLAYNWQSGGDVRLSFGLPNLQANQVPAIGVRRLTPLECERLQGFPDGWTDGQSDSARYRQLGNAVGVPHSEWLGRRIMQVYYEGKEA